MVILGNIIWGIAEILDMFLQIYMFIILGRVIISWVNADPYNPIVRFLVRTTEPVMYKTRKWMPFLYNVGGLDLTPLAILGAILLMRHAVVANLFYLSKQLTLQ